MFICRTYLFKHYVQVGLREGKQVGLNPVPLEEMGATNIGISFSTSNLAA